MCENLIYSIRESGCALPIRLIHFGGDTIKSDFISSQVELLSYEDFSTEAKSFIANLRTVLTDCPLGFLYRFLALFGDWDEFIYSDNDVVALRNWEEMLEYLSDSDIVHADNEYLTGGIFNYNQPEEVKKLFGNEALTSAFTAGHMAIRKSGKLISDINEAIEWFKKYPSIPKKHDQALLHVASLLGNWRVLNLCKPSLGWLSSWAGDYKNSLMLIHSLQKGNKISHLHYSGSTPLGNLPVEELLLSNKSAKKRLGSLLAVSLKEFSGFFKFQFYRNKGKRKLIELKGEFLNPRASTDLNNT